MYQQDIFYESTVNREIPSGVKVIANLSLALAIINGILTILFLAFGGYLFLIPTILFGILAYIERQNTSMSFDYSYTNGELDIARVTGGRKRKLILTIKEGDIEVLAPTHSDPVQQFIGNHMRTKDCSSHTTTDHYYVMIAKDEKSGERTKVICEPGLEILAILKRMVPSRIHLFDDDAAEIRKQNL